MHSVSGFRKAQVFQKLLGFIEFWALLDFSDFFLFEQAVGKLVGWFSSSARLLFRFSGTLSHLKIRKLITYWSLDAVNIKKSLIITVTTNWNWIKFGAGFAGFFNRFYPPKNLFYVLASVWTIFCMLVWRWYKGVSSVWGSDCEDGRRFMQSHDVYRLCGRVLLAVYAGNLRHTLPQVSLLFVLCML